MEESTKEAWIGKENIGEKGTKNQQSINSKIFRFALPAYHQVVRIAYVNRNFLRSACGQE